MLPIEEYIGGMEETLDGLDELMKGRKGERLTQLSELNAELEDTLMLLGEIDMEDEDALEQMAETLADIEDLGDEYMRLAADDAALESLAQRLKTLAGTARANL